MVAKRPFITDVSIEKSIQILADPNVSYTLLYWDIFSVGATARELLAFGNAKWSNELVHTSRVGVNVRLLFFFCVLLQVRGRCE
jgi:hypothetical protein